MTIRTFIFCDICNPQGLRSLEFRRKPRKNERTGRRLCDARAWFEGDFSSAVEGGWSINNEGQHTCPACNKVTR